MPSRILALENPLRRYAWGSPTALPRLLGRPNPGGEPWAELWIGAHPLAPSVAVSPRVRRPLDELIEAHADAILGPDVAARFGGRLPFLAKLLAAAEPLSLQCHPDAVQALAGFAREEAAGIPLDAPQRCYRDPYAKPELICALTPFVALKGFRAVPEILAAFSALPSLAPERAALEASPDGAGLARFFSAVMTLAPERRDLALEEAIRAADADAAPTSACLLQLAERYPGDIGVLAPLWLNRVELAPGEALFLPAGELHSYLEGVGLEVMGSSDNVLRGGLTPKHLDVAELLHVLTFRSGPAEVLRPRPAGEGVAGYDVPAAEFALTRIDLAGGSRELGGRRGVEVLLLIEGEATISSGEEAAHLAPGAAALVPASAGGYTLAGEGRLYRVEVGGL